MDQDKEFSMEERRNRMIFRHLLLRFKCAILDGRLSTSYDEEKDSLFLDSLCENYEIFPRHIEDNLGI